MAYNNVSDAIVRKVCKKYGEGSIECQVISLVREARVPYECIAEVMKANPEEVKMDITGTFKMSEPQHSMLVKFLTTLLPMGLERGVLPCKDTALTTSVLKLLLETYGCHRRVNTLQETINALQKANHQG